MMRRGFTLMEVLVATAVAGLIITAGFRLIAMSYKLLGEIQGERDLISAADMPSSGKDDKKGYSWEAEEASIPVKDYELQYRKVTVKIADGRSTVIYVNQ